MRRGSEYNQLAYRDVRQNPGFQGSGEKCILTRKYMIVWGLNTRIRDQENAEYCKVP